MREAVSASIKVMSLYFLIEKIPDLLQLIGTYQSIGASMDESYAFYALASTFTVLGISVILFFCSGGIARIIVPYKYEEKFELTISKRAIYISSGLVLAALNITHAADLAFASNSMRQFGFPEGPEKDNSAYYFICYGVIILLCGLLIKKGRSCEE